MNKKNAKINKREVLITTVGVIIALAVLVMILLNLLPGGKDKKTDESTTVQNSVAEDTDELSVIDNIQGLLGKDYNDESSLVDENLSIELIGSYNGLFVEDGSDRPIEDALSLLVKNKGTQTLQIGLITLSDGEKEYEFQVTTLPAGETALVLEKNMAQYDDSKSYVVTAFSSGYFASTTLMEDSLEITAKDGTITVKNTGTETYSKLYVYYKVKKSDGTYMGGITYRTPVENLKPGDVQDVVAAHYKETSGHIMMVVEAAVE